MLRETSCRGQGLGVRKNHYLYSSHVKHLEEEIKRMEASCKGENC